MTETVTLIALFLFFAGIIWIGVSKASEDGFFTSLCTLLVVFSAFHFVNLQWSAFYNFLRVELEMTGAHGISTAYWIGFALIIAPGMLIARLLAKPKVPFPPPFEHYGTIAAGGLVGLILFATIVQSLAKFDFFATTLAQPLGYFRFLFQILGAQHITF